MDLVLDGGLCGRAFHPDHHRAVAKALSAWDFAIEVQRRALWKGKRIALWSHEGRVLWALEGTPKWGRALAAESLIGVYDADVLVRDLAADLREYFA